MAYGLADYRYHSYLCSPDSGITDTGFPVLRSGGLPYRTAFLQAVEQDDTWVGHDVWRYTHT